MTLSKGFAWAKTISIKGAPGILAPLVPILTTLALLVGWPTSAKAEQGTVLDKGNGRPIPNAIVIATWHGVAGTVVQGSTRCYKVEMTRSDEQGRFDVSALSWNLNPLLINRIRAVTAWAPGYVLSPTWNPATLEIPLERRLLSSTEMMQSLPSIEGVGCDGAEKVMLPYLKALYTDKLKLATTIDERLAAAYVLFSIEVIELGSDEALKRTGPREAAIRTKD